jgi:single-stranded DNA-binding protein
MYQKYVIVGRLTKDGENRFLPNGTQVYKNLPFKKDQYA